MEAETVVSGSQSVDPIRSCEPKITLPSSRALDLLPKQQQKQLSSQQELLSRQTEQLKRILERQEQLLASCRQEGLQLQQVASGKEAEPFDTRGGTPVRQAKSVSDEDLSPATRLSRLEPKAEQILLARFGIQDTLTPEALVYLASKAECSEVQVREYFTRLRSSMRSFLQKLQRRASGAATGSHANPAMPGIPSAAGTETHMPASADDNRASQGQDDGSELSRSESPEELAKSFKDMQARLDTSREAGLQRLRVCVTDKGGLKSPEAAERIIGLMQTSSSWCVREACLQAVLQTSLAHVQRRLASSQALLSLLEMWVEASDADGQISFLRSLLLALQHLRPDLSGADQKPLLAALTQLQHHKSLHVASEAKIFVEQLSKREEPPKSVGPLTVSGLQAPAMQTAFPGVRPGNVQAAKYTEPKNKRKRPAAEFQAATRPSKQPSAFPSIGQTSRPFRADMPTSFTPTPTAAGGLQQPATFRPKAEVDLQQQRLQHTFQRYRERQIQIVNARNGRLAVELSRMSKGLADGAKMKPLLRGPYAILEISAAALAGFQLGQGEESLERNTREQQIQARAAVVYSASEDIPFSPAEPDEAALQPTGKLTVKVPFHPVDPDEAKEQVELQKSSGVALSHLLGATAQPVMSLHHRQPIVKQEDMEEEDEDDSEEEREEEPEAMQQPIFPPVFRPV